MRAFLWSKVETVQVFARKEDTTFAKFKERCAEIAKKLKLQVVWVKE